MTVCERDFQSALDRLLAFDLDEFNLVHGQVLSRGTSESRGSAMRCNRRGLGPDGLDLWLILIPFQPPRVQGDHY